MDNELVSDSLFGESQGRRDPDYTYTQDFYKMFPYYLSIGMTPEQYWDGDPMLVKYYREAECLRRQRVNEELWLQGLYVYEAICDVAPVLHAFAKRGTKAHPYIDAPYPIDRVQKELQEETKEKAVFDKGMVKMEAFMAAHNKKFAEKSKSK